MLFVRVLESEGRVVEEAGEVVGEVFEDHVAVVLFDHDLLQFDHVFVVQRLEELDFSDGRHGELIESAKFKKANRGITLTPSLSPSIRIFLRATLSPVYTWIARKTLP